VTALEVFRADEQRALAHLSGTPTRLAWTEVAISRALYQLIEPPPTRHRIFVIKTVWDYEQRIAQRHTVIAGGRQVVGYRPGLFGGAR
jgi:hypothetical protein